MEIYAQGEIGISKCQLNLFACTVASQLQQRNTCSNWFVQAFLLVSPTVCWMLSESPQRDGYG